MGKAWKELERKIAKSLGTRRTPLSGSNSGHDTNSDTLSKDLYVEAKYRKSFYTVSLYDEEKPKAVKENKPLVLALQAKGRHGALAVIDWDFFVRLWNNYGGK